MQNEEKLMRVILSGKCADAVRLILNCIYFHHLPYQ